ISGFAGTDVIDLAGITFDSGGTISLNSSTNVLTISEGGSSYTLAFQQNQLFLGQEFALTSDGGTGTEIILNQVPISGSATVPSGKEAYNVLVAPGGTVDIQPGGQLSGGTVSSGGSLTISSGGTAAGATVSDGGQQVVASGGVASNTILTDPGSGIVSGGGTALNYLVSGGALDNFGLAISTVVESGLTASGLMLVESGAQASATLVSAGGFEIISSGGVDSAA